jgi:predicted metal-dependent phosphoesterase TrpH
VIDLHLHTTASDGQLSPAALVERAVRRGITILSITDHDTTAALDAAAAAAARHGVTLVPGIEITAVEQARDVHILGYFIDARHAGLSAFLARQRGERLRRVARIGERLAQIGYPIDTGSLVSEADQADGHSVGRPRVADALIAAGHVRDRDEAFARLLGDNRPAFVPRSGEPPEAVIAVIRDAGGIASLAHPGLLRMDHLIGRLAAADLAAVEACHSDHDEAAERRYRALAAQHGLAVSGGSDFHGDADRRVGALGAVTLPIADFERLRALAA